MINIDFKKEKKENNIVEVKVYLQSSIKNIIRTNIDLNFDIDYKNLNKIKNIKVHKSLEHSNISFIENELNKIKLLCTLDLEESLDILYNPLVFSFDYELGIQTTSSISDDIQNTEIEFNNININTESKKNKITLFSIDNKEFLIEDEITFNKGTQYLSQIMDMKKNYYSKKSVVSNEEKIKDYIPSIIIKINFKSNIDDYFALEYQFKKKLEDFGIDKVSIVKLNKANNDNYDLELIYVKNTPVNIVVDNYNLIYKKIHNNNLSLNVKVNYNDIIISSYYLTLTENIKIDYETLNNSQNVNQSFQTTTFLSNFDNYVESFSNRISNKINLARVNNKYFISRELVK